MLVKDIIKLACDFVDEKPLANKLANATALSEEDMSEIKDFVDCFNLVREEIATEISPIVQIEKLKTTNLKVSFNEFSFSPVRILAVKDGVGRNVRHKVLNDAIIAFASEVEVWYSIKPENLNIDDEFSSTYPERVFAYGVAREYYIKNALYNDAEIWEERFKNSLEMLAPKKSGRMVARRRWL